MNLPSLEYRNTNIKNYADSAVIKGIAKSPSDRNLNAFPANDLNFNNIIFSQNIFGIKFLKMKIKLLKLKIIILKLKMSIL